MIQPRPGHLGRYVYFHHVQEFAADKGSILYCEIDMNANGGKGKVVKKNQLLRGPVNEELAYTSFKHANGRDWWIIASDNPLNIYNRYLLTPDTIEGPFTYNLQDNIASLYDNQASWNAFFSPEGTKSGLVGLTWFDVPNRFNRIFLCELDRCTGTISNPLTIKVEDPESFDAWAQISPNSRFLCFQIGQKNYDFAQSSALNLYLIRPLDRKWASFAGRFAGKATTEQNLYRRRSTDRTGRKHPVGDLFGQNSDRGWRCLYG